jgi:hypothetical protein
MTLDPSQIINNMKRSFNVYVGNTLGEAEVNYDEDPFDTAGLASWYSVRYAGYSSESSGMGDLIDENSATKGRYHVLKCELSAWSRDDPQRAELGSMVDAIVALCEAPSVTFYDFADPENPVSIGKIYLRPGRGTFTPPWGGKERGSVLKSSGDVHSDARMVGFVMELDLVGIAEVG